MKTSILVSVWFLIAAVGCASRPVESPWTARYVGEKGYFRVPVKASPSGLKRCEPITLLKFYSDGEFLELDARQGSQTYRVTCVGGEKGCTGYLPEGAVENGRQRAVDEIFTSRIPVEGSGEVVMTRRGDGASLSPKEALCSGGLWKGMTREQVLFVMGQPSSQKTEAGVETWSFPGEALFRFEDGELVSWSN